MAIISDKYFPCSFENVRGGLPDARDFWDQSRVLEPV